MIWIYHWFLPTHRVMAWDFVFAAGKHCLWPEMKALRTRGRRRGVMTTRWTRMRANE